MSLSVEEINRKLQSQLQCPVCLETCTPPIYMCCNGHIVCATCRGRLNRCSVCRAPGQPTGRCTPLEQIAEFVRVPCTNRSRGCPQSLSITDVAQHALECDYGYKCLVCKNWEGTVNDLKGHVVDKHSKDNDFISSIYQHILH